MKKASRERVRRLKDKLANAKMERKDAREELEDANSTIRDLEEAIEDAVDTTPDYGETLSEGKLSLTKVIDVLNRFKREKTNKWICSLEVGRDGSARINIRDGKSKKFQCYVGLGHDC